MHPKKHILLGLLFSLLLLFLDSVTLYKATIIWFSSWLIIDLDHILFYFSKTGNLNPVRFWRWSEERNNFRLSLEQKEKKKYKLPLFIFHGIEPLFLVLFLSFFFPLFIYVFVGFAFHLLCDWINLIIRKEDIFSKISIIYVLFYNLDKKPFPSISLKSLDKRL